MNIKTKIKNSIIYSNVNYFYNRFFISDKKAIKKKFKKRLNRFPNLSNPVLFNDKLQWLKLNWYDPIAVQMADKYKVRELVADIIGEKYLNELIAVYNDINEINLSDLPNAFVLKGTHGSGYNIICKNKKNLNWKAEKRKIKRWLKQNYYWSQREWVYKDIKPRIICEKYLVDEESNNTGLTDYKFFCFNGVPYYCQVIQGRGSHETIDFFDLEWNHMPFVGLRLLPNSKIKPEKPEKYDEMIILARKLSKRFPFVRVDFYYVNKKIYFGEMTFFPMGGFGRFDPPEWDRKLGELLVLPKKNSNI